MSCSERLKKASELFGRERAQTLLLCAEGISDDIYEIRVYTGTAIAFYTGGGLRFCLENGGVSSFLCSGIIKPSVSEVYGIVSAAAGNSVFLKEREIKSGYLTKDGIRVGVCGFSPGGVLFSEGISSINIRIPFENTDLELSEEEKILLKNARGMLVAGPPASGKTTFLKKCAVALAGGRLGKYYKTAVIDERDEFYSSLSRSPGVITVDIIRGRSKISGIQMALRLLSPEYIICDETGSVDEADEMLEGMNSGVIFLASIHAGNIFELKKRAQFIRLWDNGVFDIAVFLSDEKKGQISAIYKRGEGEI